MAPINEDEWQAIDARSPAPTFFARPAWSRSMAQTYPEFELHPLRFWLNDGRSALVPLMRRRTRLPWRIFEGMPIWGYTTVLSEDNRAAEPDVAEATLRHLFVHVADGATVSMWPFGSIPNIEAWRTKERETSVIDMQDGIDAVMSRMDGNARRMAGQADRRGVVCTRETGASAVDTYDALLAEAVKKWDRTSSPIPKRLIEALVENGSNGVEIWFARHEGEVIGGGIVFFGREELFFWSAAMRADAAGLRPSNALNVCLLRRAHERDVRWYNLGASDGLPGVARFKAGLGAATVRYPQIRSRRGLFAAYDAVRSLGARR